MPFSFPGSPSIGQTSLQNGRQYVYVGGNVWELVASVLTDPRWDVFLPAAPTGLTVTGGNAQASLSWTAPTGVIAQAPIQDYTVQFKPSGGAFQTFTRAASTATSVTVTGLNNGTAYVFRVATVNSIGTGSYTVESSSVTPTAALFSATAAGWSGAGTAASKLVAPSSPTDFAGGTVSDASFTVGLAGTVRVTGTHHDANDGYAGRVSKNGSVVYDNGSYGTADVSIVVAPGDVIRVFGDGPARWYPNTRVWLVP